MAVFFGKGACHGQPHRVFPRLAPRGIPRPSAATAAGPVTEDSVQLSVGPGILPAALTGGPPVDTALVSRIGTAIAAGRYPVDPDRIAEALFRDYADLTG
jgi:negative regulator of flagellin synthesis FlgM